MDTLCGIGLPELVIVLLIAFVAIGPERGRDVALQAGRALSKLMRSPWWREFNDVTSALRDLPTTLVRMAELEEAQEDLQRAMRDIEHETEVDLSFGKTQEAGSGTANPWGIQNATAQTTIHGEEDDDLGSIEPPTPIVPPPAAEPDDDDDTPERSDG